MHACNCGYSIMFVENAQLARVPMQTDTLVAKQKLLKERLSVAEGRIQDLMARWQPQQVTIDAAVQSKVAPFYGELCTQLAYARKEIKSMRHDIQVREAEWRNKDKQLKLTQAMTDLKARLISAKLCDAKKALLKEKLRVAEGKIQDLTAECQFRQCSWCTASKSTQSKGNVASDRFYDDLSMQLTYASNYTDSIKHGLEVRGSLWCSKSKPPEMLDTEVDLKAEHQDELEKCATSEITAQGKGDVIPIGHQLRWNVSPTVLPSIIALMCRTPELVNDDLPRSASNVWDSADSSGDTMLRFVNGESAAGCLRPTTEVQQLIATQFW